jgi:glycosyltransferase involved in cell wall biosynthesis
MIRSTCFSITFGQIAMAKIILSISDSFCAGFIAGQPTYYKTKGHTVSIISSSGEEISQLTKRENVFLYTIKFSKRITPLYDLLCLWKIYKILRKEKPDVVNAGNPKSGLLTIIAAYLCKVPVRIFTLHGLPSDAKKGITKWIVTQMEKLTCALAHKVIVVSPSLQNHAIKRNIVHAKKAIALLPASCNGLNTQYFAPSAQVLQEAAQLRNENGIQPEDFVIGYAGRINLDKGIPLLIEAFLEVLQQFNQVKLLLVGPMQVENSIPEKYISIIANHKSILHVGKINHMPMAYTAMDVLVLPSYREGFGYALIEAAAMEKAVIAPDIPGCQDAVLANKNGLLFSKGNKNALIESLTFYLKNPIILKNHGMEGRKWVVNQFEQEKIWKQVLEITKFCLGNRG